MKKLMLLASAVAMACSIQAASFNWGFVSTDITDINGEYMGDVVPGYAYVFLGTVSATDTAFDMTGTTLLASGGQNDDFTYGSLTELASNDALTKTDAGQAYSLILTETKVSDFASFTGNYILATGDSTLGSDPMTGDTWAMFNDATAYGAGDWKTMGSVPEPTSGILLLLGIAGLALRRKQA